jgi:hypothetical protein
VEKREEGTERIQRQTKKEAKIERGEVLQI